MPERSRWHTALPLPGASSQQSWEALTLTLPPSGSFAVPQVLPTPLQLWPLSQRPPAQSTLPLGLMPPPQQSLAFEQEVPVRRQPPAGRHTVTPEPGSKQMREQHEVPLVQGLPS